MKILIYLNHPAHFHLFKNVIFLLKKNKHEVLILSKKKDVLDELLQNSEIVYTNVLIEGRKNSKSAIIYSVLKRGLRLYKIIKRQKPDLMIATAFELAHIGKLLGIPFISVSEDDAEIIPLWSKYSYPFATKILSPTTCNNGKWESKSIKYKGYHELAYLHPKLFIPEIEVCNKYFDARKPYFVLRFSGLTAHHDEGINGINDVLALRLVKLLEKEGNVFITSERPLIDSLEKYRAHINPLDIHHILAYATLYIGDSQTMAAEAGVLGTPFIRFNDFVGKIGYLNELEKKYKLGYGYKSNEQEEMIQKVRKLIKMKNIREVIANRRAIMLKDKIELSSFITWFIENFPESVTTMENKPEFQNSFK